MHSNLRQAKIVATSLYAPENLIPNSYFDDLYKKDVSSFLREQRNILQRRYMRQDQRTSDLILPAAQEVLQKAGLRAKDLDLIIVATDTPDYLSPSTASVVQHSLGAVRAGTFDLNSACAGFVTALDVGSKFIASDSAYENILVVG
ncbi:MAG: ketoacyl-ACP synthase III, partial [Bdellovibrio sp.]